jgi:hypothetical protein
MIVRLPNRSPFYDVLQNEDTYAELRNRETGEQFVVSARVFREFITVSHPSTTKKEQ